MTFPKAKRISASIAKMAVVFVYLFSGNTLTAQTRNTFPGSTTPNFVISYAIVVKGKKIDGIAETYNGGVKTIFVKDNMVRLRLVSLMRTQSIFFTNKKTPSKVAAVVKESGLQKNKFYLNAAQWKIYNDKYDSNKCEFFKEDTIRILDKLCQKAVITTKAGAIIDAWYIPGAKNKAISAAEPLFSCIPGLVMKYTYAVGEKSIEYTATSVSTKQIAASVFAVPAKGYILQHYRPGTTNVNATDLNNDGIDDMTEEEEEMDGN